MSSYFRYNRNVRDGMVIRHLVFSKNKFLKDMSYCGLFQNVMHMHGCR